MRGRGGRRLNDTVALRGEPLDAGDSRSVSVERADNGFVVRSTSYNSRTGEFKESKQISRTPPRLGPGNVQVDNDAGGVGREGLSDTMRYLKDGE